MATEKVTIIAVDPYDPNLGVLAWQLIPRLIETVEAIGDDVATVKQFMGRLFAGDPNVVLVAAVTKSGVIKGFGAAQITNEMVIMIQPRLDEPTTNDAMAEMIQLIEDWAKSKDKTTISLIARRLDTKWTKKFDFEVSRYVLVKELQ